MPKKLNDIKKPVQVCNLNTGISKHATECLTKQLQGKGTKK
jgi:hypothetical protein